jgi:glycine betaine transporter
MKVRVPKVPASALAIAATVAIVAVALRYPDDLETVVLSTTEAVFSAIDWFYLSSVTLFLVLSAWLAFGKFGRIKLGEDDDEPEFSTLSWLAMLFSAGMGAGLLFWSVAEPISHYSQPPIGEPNSAAAARQALLLANFHWGLHAWAIYCLAGLVLAFFHFRLQAPYLPGAPLKRAFRGAWVEPMAAAADFIAILAVALGVAGALTLGVMQIHTGLAAVTELSGHRQIVALTILACVGASAMTSAATALDRGIKWLSNVNLWLAIALLVFVLLAGPTALLLRTFVSSLGDYATNLVALSFRLYPYENLGPWMHSWTLTYLIWWIAWAPFVGVFIARISRGRTIREFVFGVLLAPTLFSILWFALFGGAALAHEQWGTGGLSHLVHENVSSALFALLDQMPLSNFAIWIAVVLVFIFIITSVDSAMFVLSMLTSGGTMNPPRNRKLTWGLLLLALTAGLLLGGRASTIRTVAIAGAIPFTFILLLQIAALVRVLVHGTLENQARDE